MINARFGRSRSTPAASTRNLRRIVMKVKSRLKAGADIEN